MGQDTRLYPGGAGTPKARSILNTFVEFGVVKQQKTRVTLVQLNAGFTLLPALPGVKWRLLDWAMISNGGAATAATSANIVGTRAAAAVQLAVTAVAALTRSALVRAGASNAVILADGASFTALDANTAVTLANVGSAMTTLTSIDIFLTYVADPA